MDNPFFTVVIPTHNRSNLLKRAVESVIDQTFENFELIIVDDHSTDGTSSVVKSLADPRIRYMLNCRTKGACGARNTGIFAAKGKWVAFLDDDDVWLPEKLRYQYEKAINVNHTIGLICTDYAILKDKQSDPVVIKNRPSGWVRDKLLYDGGIGCLSSSCIRSDILSLIGGFDERFPSSQDQDLWFRVAEVSEFTYVPKTLVHMYQEKRKDRIGQNAKCKLEGYIMLRKKYSALIDQSLRLRHRYESPIFTYALLRYNRSLVAKCLPWVLLGLLIDLPHFSRTIQTTLYLFFSKTVRRHLNL
jgi:glycosyltransferase involved in cell wall biosynthesis